ncbi:hypothetical protein SCUP515_08971 [Seiridium cupressi]
MVSLLQILSLALALLHKGLEYQLHTSNSYAIRVGDTSPILEENYWGRRISWIDLSESYPTGCDKPECEENKHKYKNWHSFYRDFRTKRDFSGKSAGLKEHYKALGRGGFDLEDEPFVPGPDEVRKVFDRNGNQLGPSSGASQQISAH